MDQLPVIISILFAATTLLTVFIFYKAAGYSKLTLPVLLLWLVVQAPVAICGFYTDTSTLPPKFMLLVVPPLLTIAGLFAIPAGRRYLNQLDIRTLTILHIVRIPVELVLYSLCIYKTVPVLMTFEGRNVDILSGLTAPVVYYFAFVKKRLHKRWLLVWNFICLGLLVNIVVHAILSAPFPFQRFAFDQPNIAILYFPFVWLPCCVVPLVLLSHLTAIKQLLKK